MSVPEDFAHFFDTIHGRVPFSELPSEFIPPLRVALNSPFLDRLTRINQLGYTSLTFFSATQTRFSHAVGTLLTMNKIIGQLWGRSARHSIPAPILTEVATAFPQSQAVGGDASVSLRCHLLLAALLQDIGELPFQKITSLYFDPAEKEINALESHPQLAGANPRSWIKTKDVFAAAAILDLFTDRAFDHYDLSFLVYLISGYPISTKPELLALRGMVDGVIDADRLDYVFRDAHLTIGSVTDADRVIRSILRYQANKVIVSDPQPAADFFATRARLWTFVYAAPAVRFRQALLKAFLSACLASDRGIAMLRDHGFSREMSLQEFLRSDDHSLLTALRAMSGDTRLGDIANFGREARAIMVKIVTDYECRVFERQPVPSSTAATPATHKIQANVFFDLLADQDGEHRLYIEGSVLVEQPFLAKLPQPVLLERAVGALAPLLKKDTTAPLIRESFLLFIPEAVHRSPIQFHALEAAMTSDVVGLYRSLQMEELQRELAVANDTWPTAGVRKRIAISCCFSDRPHIIRIVRELARQREPYRLLLDSLLGLGNTSAQNSQQLIADADAVIVLMSAAYADKWLLDPRNNIALEVVEIRKKPKQRKVVLALESYAALNSRVGSRWSEMEPSWTAAPILASQELHNGDDRLRGIVISACTWINQ
jgi:HD superfamily phosphohydrolase